MSGHSNEIDEMLHKLGGGIHKLSDGIDIYIRGPVFFFVTYLCLLDCYPFFFE